MKICTLLQFHFSDLHKNFDKNNIFKKISTKEYKKKFNPVIISSDQKENFILKKYSKKYKIPIIFGSPTNLISRIKKVIKTKFNILNFKGVFRGIIGDKIGNAALIIAKKQ